MAEPSTHAHSLHDLLIRVRDHESNTNTIRKGWEGVLGAKFDSPEFAKRHAEVATLLAVVIDQVGGLSPSQRGRYERYIPTWWRAVVAPDNSWTGQGEVRQIISQGDLDQLAAVGDVIAAQFRGTVAAPTAGDELVGLREACEEWRDYLDATDALPPVFRDLLLQDLGHLLWLIDNAELFGVARVASYGDQVIGSLSVAPVEHAERATWTGKLTQLTARVAVIAGFLASVNLAIEQSDDLIEHVVDVVDHTDGDDSPPKELGSGPRQ